MNTALPGVNVLRLQVGILKNDRILLYGISKLVPFHAFSWNPCILLIFNLSPYFDVQKSSLAIFRFLRKTAANSNPNFSVCHFFGLATLDTIDLKCVHRTLMMVIIESQI